MSKLFIFTVLFTLATILAFNERNAIYDFCYQVYDYDRFLHAKCAEELNWYTTLVARATQDMVPFVENALEEPSFVIANTTDLRERPLTLYGTSVYLLHEAFQLKFRTTVKTCGIECLRQIMAVLHLRRDFLKETRKEVCNLLNDGIKRREIGTSHFFNSTELIWKE